MRVHLCQCRMTCGEADILEAYLKGISCITEVKVYERTADAVVRYDDSAEARAKVLAAFSEFDYTDCEVTVPGHSGRKLSHEYVDKMAGQILRWTAEKLVMPVRMRRVRTCIRSVPRIWEALCALRRMRLEVSVLDAASVLVSLLRSDFDTASSVMFLLGIGETMEEWSHKKSVNDLASAFDLNVGKVWVKTEWSCAILVRSFARVFTAA